MPILGFLVKKKNEKKSKKKKASRTAKVRAAKRAGLQTEQPVRNTGSNKKGGR